MCLAGDNLIVDLDLSEANLPAGSRLAIGDEVVIEISDHAAHRLLESSRAATATKPARSPTTSAAQSLHLRGRYARIVTGGTIAVGDAMRKRRPS